MRLAFLLLLAAARAWGWEGKVVERGAGPPIEGALFQDLSGTALGQSGPDGAFSILSPPARVRVSALGFAPRTLAPGPSKVALKRVEFEAEEITITGRREKNPGHSALEGSQIRRIAGAAGDALRAIKTLPSVASISDFSGGLSVRGGGPEDNKYFIDSIPWPVPYHFGGFLTTINAELLESVELYAGGFPARYGNASGAVIEAKTRPGKRRYAGNADVNLVTASALLEGPLGAGGSWTLSGRRSYFDLILPHVMDLGGTALPFFWDLGATLRYDFSPTSRLRVLAMGTDDQMSFLIKKEDVHSSNFAGEFRFHNAFGNLGLNWESEWGALSSRSVVFGFGQGSDFAFGSGYFIDSRYKVGGARQEFGYRWGAHSFGAGGDYMYVRSDVSGYIFARSRGAGPGAGTVSDPRGITFSAELGVGGAYVEDTWKLSEPLSLGLGLRYERGWQQIEALTPRTELRWKAGPSTLLRAAWGKFAQSPNGTQLSEEFGNPHLSAPVAEHRVLSAEQRLGGDLSCRLEAYHKTWQGLVIEVPDARTYANDSEGQASGLELYLKHDGKGRFFGWLSGSWSRSERKDSASGGWHLYEYDQPWSLSLVSSYRITPSWDFSLSCAWHAGALLTPVVGAYYDAVDDSWVPIYGAPLSVRLGDYLRLDLKTEYKWAFESWALSFYIELLNATDSPNPLDRRYSRDFSSYEEVEQIPRLPYFGLTASF
jgi:outer membrane receptor protein involved in Fe transport